MPFSDCHAHLDLFPENHANQIIERAKEANIEIIISASVDYQSSLNTIRLAQRYGNFIRPAVGIHPWFVQELEGDEIQKVLRLAHRDEVAAISETGLDYKWNSEAREKQVKLLRQFMEIGEKTGKPLIIHVLDAFDEAIQTIENFPSARGAVHCFGGTIEQGEKLASMGFYPSMSNGLLSDDYPSVKEVASKLSLEKMVIDTDALPETFEVCQVTEIAKVIAKEKDLTPERVGKVTTQNLKSILGNLD